MRLDESLIENVFVDLCLAEFYPQKKKIWCKKDNIIVTAFANIKLAEIQNSQMLHRSWKYAALQQHSTMEHMK